jgi:hypothetical protein
MSMNVAMFEISDVFPRAVVRTASSFDSLDDSLS